MAGMLKVSRSRGALSGVLLVLLAIWGGLIPLVGPYVHYAYTPDHAWRMTSGRLWLEILPAAGAFLGGLVLVASRLRPMALLGASLAAASGAWFAGAARWRRSGRTRSRRRESRSAVISPGRWSRSASSPASVS